VSERRILILGYGNPGRGDDGLGPALVERIEALELINVSVDADYQLNIEDAAQMAEHDMVLFVDASTDAVEPYELSKVQAASAITFTSHSVSPQSLVAMCEDHFSASPQTWVLAIRGYDFEFAEGLSERAERNLKQAFEFTQSQIRLWRE
jgi:hydrogenase maturation protease